MKRFVMEVVTMQQDYLWFLASLGLMGALIAVLRPGADRSRYAWVGGVLAGNLAMTLAELVRIAQAVRPPEFGPPNLVMDLLLGTILALQVCCVWWPAGRKDWGWVLLGAVLVLAGLRFAHPWSVTLGLSGAAMMGLIWRGRREPDPLGRKLAWSLVPAFWLSPVGPATIALNNWIVSLWSGAYLAGAPREEELTALTVGLRRWEMTGPWGIWASTVMLGTGILCLWQLTRRQWTADERQELRRFIPLTVIWLAAGLTLAAGLGWRTKSEFEDSQKMRVNLAAKLLHPADLAAAFGPKFDPKPDRPGPAPVLAMASREFGEAVMPVRRQLATIQTELPADSYAFILVERNGYRAVGAVAATIASRSSRVMLLEAEPDFATDLQTRFLPPYQEVYGLVTQARAPLYFPDGRFLGWLTLQFGAAEWLAGQTQARLQALAIVGLGFGIALMLLRQRLRNLARDEALRGAEIARRANEAKSQFLARVSHELRTPIQSVLGNCELLQPVLQDEASRARLAALRQHGLLMARLVEDLLDLGALQTGRFHLVPRPTQLGELVRQTTDSLRTRAEAKGLEFRVTIQEPDTAWRLADGERVRQVVLNLVSNAIKFTDHGVVEVGFGPLPDGALQFMVSDTGPGIPPGEVDRLFQPFARLEATAAKQGSGLGLALARGLCEDMHGSLVLARQSPGACFVARLQLPVCAPPPRQDEPLRLPALPGRTILVVDDNTLVRELFQTCFLQLGALCDAVADGPAALRRMAGTAYDTVVLDLDLPGMNGAEVAQNVGRSGRPRPRIIGVSAHASTADRARALAAGMDAFFTKPVDLQTLVREIKADQPGTDLSSTLPGLVGRLQEQFRAEAPGLRSALTAALAVGDLAAVAAKAHYLKNSADVLGLRDLAIACRDLEAAAAGRDHQTVESATEACQVHLRAWS